MIPQRGAGAGRPRVSSRQTIEEAAAELFLEQGYDGTTVDDIARRAGVGRATFFNYFASKPDLLWVDVDAALERLEDDLVASASAGWEGVVDALRVVAAGLGPERIPLVVSQLEVMGARAEVLASGLARVARLTGAISAAMAAAEPEADPVVRATASSALAGATVSAWYAWAAAGVRRGRIEPYLARALTVVRSGLDETLRRSGPQPG